MTCAFGSGIRADYIRGMARRDGDFLILLDVGQVLSISEMVSLGDAARAGGQSTEPTESPEGS